MASAANPPSCDPAVYPRPFLAFESVYKRSTRWVETNEREHMVKPRDQADVEYPFPVRVDRTKGPSSTHMIHSYPRDEVGIRFRRREKATVTATYVEIHTEYDMFGNGFNVRCTRMIRTHYKAPPRRGKPGYHP